MTTWQTFSIIIDILFVAYYMSRIEIDGYKFSWNMLFLAFWSGFLLHDIKII